MEPWLKIMLGVVAYVALAIFVGKFIKAGEGGPLF